MRVYEIEIKISPFSTDRAFVTAKSFHEAYKKASKRAKSLDESDVEISSIHDRGECV